ncbi:MAG: YhbY family RNA-binding protein [Treponemataceae bacterium]|nr:YhbY family RNA-binding protein [Treponemataceae bacterium]
MELTSKQRKLLEKYAQPMSAIVIVGGAGVTDGIHDMLDKSLASHELLKVKFNEYKDEKETLSAELAERSNAVLVRIIGNVAIFYRPAEKAEDRKYEKELNKLS